MEIHNENDQVKLNDLINELQVVRGSKRSVALDYLIECLKKGNVHAARVECANSVDKLDQPPELRMALAKGLFSKDERTPWGKIGEGLLKEIK